MHTSRWDSIFAGAFVTEYYRLTDAVKANGVSAVDVAVMMELVDTAVGTSSRLATLAECSLVSSEDAERLQAEEDRAYLDDC